MPDVFWPKLISGVRRPLRMLAERLFGFDFFISYSRHSSAEYAQALSVALKERGFRSFLDEAPDGFLAGGEIDAETRRAVSASTAMILVVNSRTFDSPFVRDEVRRFRDRQRLIVPIDVDQTLAKCRNDESLLRSWTGADDVVEYVCRSLIAIDETCPSSSVPTNPVVEKIAGSLGSLTRAAFRMRLIVATLALVTVLLLATGVFWFLEREARLAEARQNRIATARLWSAAAREQLGRAPTAALLAAATAVSWTRPEDPYVPEAEQAIRDALGRISGRGLLTRNGLAVTAVALSEDENLVAVGDMDGNVCVQRTDASDAAPNEIAGHGASVLAMAFDPTGKSIAVWDENGALRLQRVVDARRLLWTVASEAGAINPELKFVAQGKKIAAIWGSITRRILLIDVNSGAAEEMTHTTTDGIETFGVTWSAVVAERLVTVSKTPNGASVEAIDLFSPAARPQALQDFSIPATSSATCSSKRLVAVGLENGEVHVLSLAEPGEWRNPKVENLVASKTRIAEIVFSNQGDRMVTVDDDARATIWKRGKSTWEAVGSPNHQGDVLRCTGFSSSGQYVVFWSGIQRRLLEGSTAPLSWFGAVIPSADGEAILTFAIEPPSNGFDDVRCLPQSENCVAKASDAKLHVASFDMLDVRQSHFITLAGHEGPIDDLLVGSHGKYLVTKSRDGTARIWDMTDIIVPTHPRAPMTQSADPSIAVCATYPKSVRIDANDSGMWIQGTVTSGGSAATPERLECGAHVSTQAHSDVKTGRIVSWSADGRWFATDVASKDVDVFEVDGPHLTNRARFETRGPIDAEVTGITFDFRGSRVAVAHSDGTVALWKLPAKSSDRPFATTTAIGSVNALTFCGEIVVIGRIDRLTTWNPAIVGAAEVLGCISESFQEIIASPDEKWVAARGWGREIRLWRVSGDTLGDGRTLTASSRVEVIAWRPDSARLVAGCEKGAVCSWTRPFRNTAAPDAVYSGHRTTVRSLAFSVDGKLLASGDDESAIRLWRFEDSESAPRSVVLEGHRRPVRALAFARSNEFLVSGADDESIRRWTVPLEKLSACARIAAGRNLTIAEWARYLPESPYRPAFWDLPLPKRDPAFPRASRDQDAAEWSEAYPGRPYRHTFPPPSNDESTLPRSLETPTSAESR